MSYRLLSRQHRKPTLQLHGVVCLHAQVEILHLVSAQNLVVPERQRLHYSGSNRQAIIGPVALPAWEDGWQIDAELK
eukprot:3848910-Alexandrium_andersonii.AAC.1